MLLTNDNTSKTYKGLKSRDFIENGNRFRNKRKNYCG